jgi:hypothetical protein
MFNVYEDSVEELLKNEIGYCPGWHDLIREAFKKLLYLADLFNMEEINICQIKEKFGGLRLYLDFLPTDNNEEIGTMQVQIMQSILDIAESRSLNVCQNTGKYGKLRDVNGWVMTLCDEEYEKVINKLGMKNGKS